MLVDPNRNLSNWNRGDPCTSRWTGVLCFNETLFDGYLHVQELYDFCLFYLTFLFHSSQFFTKNFSIIYFSWASMSFILHLTCYQSHSSFFIFVFQESTLLNADLSFCVWKLENFLFSATPLLSLFLLFVGNWWIWACLEIWHQKLAAYFIWKDCKTIAAFSFEMTNVLDDFKFSNCSISLFLM
jgi:hypothetical protein